MFHLLSGRFWVLKQEAENGKLVHNMSLVIRLARVGRKGEAKYRIVVKEKRSKRDGYAVDIIGHMTKNVNSLTKKIDEKKLAYWVTCGAQVSPAVKRILSFDK